MNLRLLMLNITEPVCRFIGKLHLPYTHKLIKARHYWSLMSVLKPGAILLARTRGEGTNPFIPSFWKHGAMYVGAGKVVEVLADGVVANDLIDFAMSKDYICALNPKFGGLHEMTGAACWALEHIGCEYDYLFDIEVANAQAEGRMMNVMFGVLQPDTSRRKFFCFELVYAAYKAVCPDMPFELRERMGKKTVMGDDFVNATQAWKVVWDSREAQ